MYDNESWSNIGKEIRDAVEAALRDGDFSRISDAAAHTVTGTVKNVSDMVGQAVSENISGNYTKRMEQATKARKQARQEEEQRRYQKALTTVKSRIPLHPVGKVSSVLYRVFGGIGTGVTLILAAVFGGLWLGLGSVWLRWFILMACLALGFIGMIKVGEKKSLRLKMARKYAELTGNNHYINIEDLARHMNQSTKAVLKNIRRFLAEGYFPEGHLDANETCLMLDDKIYREYLAIEKQRKIQENEQRSDTRTREVEEVTEQTMEEADELNRIIAEGQDCIRKLRDMNDNIAGEEISAKLFRLENLLKDIFESLREHPNQLPQMKKFMNYYLPTTLKLVAAYEEFDSSGANGDDIIEAKREIEKTLDTINGAFDELLNRLLRETAYDVTTDAQVLKTMLAKEGLTENTEFQKVPR